MGIATPETPTATICNDSLNALHCPKTYLSKQFMFVAISTYQTDSLQHSDQKKEGHEAELARLLVPTGSYIILLERNRVNFESDTQQSSNTIEKDLLRDQDEDELDSPTTENAAKMAPGAHAERAFRDRPPEKQWQGTQHITMRSTSTNRSEQALGGGEEEVSANAKPNGVEY
ncbi:MAG: hypothetical protein M1831_007186 [Alyxoria varia]|nr:MAG: hypothetical protein M1831_007186 [Alyxoria varia]